MTQATAKRPQPDLGDAIKWIVVASLIGVAVIGFVFAGRLYGPIDLLVTRQACQQHGDELSRPVTDQQTSNKLSLGDRVEGHCVFGPVADLDPEDGEALEDIVSEEVLADPTSAEPLEVSLADIETGRFYRWSKYAGVVLQLGAASFLVRIVADPLLDRFVRRP